ncbi:hypothetical protein [Belnapia sp. F-4-1]|nr:hypothetical protein [Belnapia sp. F-4-1]
MGSEPGHLLAGNTGPELCGQDEWLEQEHGSKLRWKPGKCCTVP